MNKIAFFGTPELTTELLDALKGNDLMPSLIVTNPDEPKGRGLKLAPPPAKLWAIEHDIPYLQPEKLNDDFVAALKKQNFDIFIVAAYGKILPERLIDTPKHGTLNVHYSLLPKYRGATPVESAILNGDEKTGVSIQKMAFKLDTGAIVASEGFDVPKDITAPELRDVLNKKAAEMLPDVIKKYIAGQIKPVPQDEVLASHSKKIKKEDGLIDPAGDSVVNDRKFRAYAAWPRTYFFVNGVRVIVSKARLEGGAWKIERVIPAGKKEIAFESFKA